MSSYGPTIELENAKKTYRRGSEIVPAVHDVTLSIQRGEFVAIVGPSGSGKTTLLNLIGCVDKSDSGVIRIDGTETNGLTERELTKIRATKIGFVFQQFFLLPTLTAEENVSLPAVFSRTDRNGKRALELLERVGLGARAKHRPAQLSGGEMQRVAIARALMNNPRILLADEPTGNLDSRSAESVLEIFEGLNRSGITVVMVTHSAELAAHANRLFHMRDGALHSVTTNQVGAAQQQ